MERDGRRRRSGGGNTSDVVNVLVDDDVHPRLWALVRRYVCCAEGLGHLGWLGSSSLAWSGLALVRLSSRSLLRSVVFESRFGGVESQDSGEDKQE